MHLGLMLFPTHDTPAPAEIGRLAEDRGFESLWFPEHTHIPASRETPYPAGGELAPEYYRTFDPFIALAAVATVTTTLRIATGVCLVNQRDPIVTAKEVATLDQISGGRFIFGVGAGWNREEMANHGTDPRTRMASMGDRIAAMKAIWTQEVASHDGPFVSFQEIYQWPKPLQQPHPPVYVGGEGPTVLDRVLAFGDAWYPNPHSSDDQLLERMTELHDRAGRAIPVTLNAVSTKPERLERYAQAGVERLVFYAAPSDRAGLEARLDTVLAAVLSAGIAV